jgi:hypothetical protein
MNRLTLKLLGSALAAIVMIAAPLAARANALVFDFSFANNTSAYGGNPGVVTGQIFGLTNNASGQAATDVVILSSGGPGTFPIDLGIIGTTIDANRFDVVNDQIVHAEFGQTFSANGWNYNALYLDLYGTYNLLQLPSNYGNADGSAGVTFTLESSSPVPEPASAALLGCGLAFLAWIRRRKVELR